MLLTNEKNSIVYVVLNRPEVRNAFHPGMIAEITETFLKLSKRKDLRAIVLRGAGKAFCAGADLNWMKEMVNYNSKENQKDSYRLFDMFNAVWSCELPVIGEIHGAAFGGALGLIACCDYVIAEEKTQLCFSEVKLGISPAVISHFILKKCSQGVVLPLMLSGKVFSPQEVQYSGLIHTVTTELDIETQVEKTCSLFRDAGKEAVRETKKLVRKMGSLNLGAAKKESAKIISERRISAEGQEGLKSYLEKRSPSWKKS